MVTIQHRSRRSILMLFFAILCSTVAAQASSALAYSG